MLLLVLLSSLPVLLLVLTPLAVSVVVIVGCDGFSCVSACVCACTQNSPDLFRLVVFWFPAPKHPHCTKAAVVVAKDDPLRVCFGLGLSASF